LNLQQAIEIHEVETLISFLEISCSILDQILQVIAWWKATDNALQRAIIHLLICSVEFLVVDQSMLNRRGEEEKIEEWREERERRSGQPIGMLQNIIFYQCAPWSQGRSLVWEIGWDILLS
jgi:hypothetical protein